MYNINHSPKDIITWCLNRSIMSIIHNSILIIPCLIIITLTTRLSITITTSLKIWMPNLCSNSINSLNRIRWWVDLVTSINSKEMIILLRISLINNMNSKANLIWKHLLIHLKKQLRRRNSRNLQHQHLFKRRSLRSKLKRLHHL